MPNEASGFVNPSHDQSYSYPRIGGAAITHIRGGGAAPRSAPVCQTGVNRVARSCRFIESCMELSRSVFFQERGEGGGESVGCWSSILF